MHQPSRVFISYSHDSADHMSRVLALADQLRLDGVNAVIDRYESAPAPGWVYWMMDQIEHADFVLMVFTEIYCRRIMKNEEPGKGLGGVWEGNLIMNAFYKAGAKTDRFVPIVFCPEGTAHVPLPFASHQYFRVSEPEAYEQLLRLLKRDSGMESHETARDLLPLTPQWEVRPKATMKGVPARPGLFFGRAKDVTALKSLLAVLPGKESEVSPPRAVAITGVPGVGKSTFVTALPYDPEIQATYPDGVFWVALGLAKPQELQSALVGALTGWMDGTSRSGATLPELIDSMRDWLRTRRALIIVDDNWETWIAGQLLRLMDDGSTVIFTSRSEDVARYLVPVAKCRYFLGDLNTDDGCDLLQELAPVVAAHRQAAAELVEALGGLPLALVVAGRILGSYASDVRGVPGLLEELRRSERLLEESPPPDMIQLTQETKNLTVAALMQRSVGFLDEEQRARFAQLSVFAAKPASFSADDAAFVWDLNASNSAQQLEAFAGLGLIQPMSDGRIQMHAILNAYAGSLLKGL